MKQYTTRQILDMIEKTPGLEGLDLPGAVLRGIDLSKDTIQAELENIRKDNPEVLPQWVSGSGGINLIEANLQEAVLLKANLQGADLWWANLQRGDLYWANLQEANLLGANLQQARLWRANLQLANLSDANLQQARLSGADLQGANLSGVDLRWAGLRDANLRGSYLHGARLDHTEMDQKSLAPAIGEELAKEYAQARDVYLRLKQNFDDLGDYAASAWAYQKERQMEKECNAPWRARSIHGKAELAEHPSPVRVFWFYARHTVKWILDWIVEYLCGYRESIGRVLFWMAASLIASATYYWHIGGVWLVHRGKGPIATASSFWHYLIYSLGAFTTTQFSTLQAADDRIRLVTGIQAIWGVFLAGLLGFVVANKIRRS